MNRLASTLTELRRLARPDAPAALARHGIVGPGRLGLSMPAMRAMARALGRDHALAIALWETGIPDAQIVAAMVADPAQLTSRQMDAWAKSLVSWDVCDQVCANAFRASPHAWRKVHVWSARKHEFVRRAAFSLLATLSVHDRTADDRAFLQALAVIEAGAGDGRNYVRKAVNWALRNIGKRNLALNAAAIAAAGRIAQQGTRSARWIAADALRELGGPAVQARLRRDPQRRPWRGMKIA